MRRLILIVSLAVVAWPAGLLLTGCESDREVEHRREVRVGDNGKVREKEKTVRESDNGTVTTEEHERNYYR